MSSVVSDEEEEQVAGGGGNIMSSYIFIIIMCYYCSCFSYNRSAYLKHALILHYMMRYIANQ